MASLRIIYAYLLGSLWFLYATTHAAPITSPLSQIGNLTCNIERLKTVTFLAVTTKDVSKLSTAGASVSDAAATAAAKQALIGLNNATLGISTILDALFKGQSPPASGRDQVNAGLTTAQMAMNGILSTDPSVTRALNKAQVSLNRTVSAGQGVLEHCD